MNGPGIPISLFFSMQSSYIHCERVRLCQWLFYATSMESYLIYWILNQKMYFLLISSGLLFLYVGNDAAQTGISDDAKVGTIFKGHERSLAERKLRDRILQGYEKPIMPNGNNSEIFLLSMGMVLTVIQEVNVYKQTVSVSAWMKLEWNDSRVTWNVTENAGLYSIPFSDADLYVPEMLMFNRYRARDTHLFAPTMIIAYYHGELIWLPPASLEVPCAMDMSKWPRDTHECVFIFGHASRDSSTFRIRPESTTINLENYATTFVEWRVVDTRVERRRNYTGVGDLYDNIRFYLTVERAPQPFLRSVFLAPQILMWLSLLIFWINDQNFRLLFGIIELIGALGMGASFWILMPPSIKPPKIAYLISASPTLILIALVCSLLLDGLCCLKCPVPRWIARIPALFRKIRLPKRNTPCENVVNGGSANNMESFMVLTDGPRSLGENFDMDWISAAVILRFIVFSAYFLVCCLLTLLTHVL